VILFESKRKCADKVLSFLNFHKLEERLYIFFSLETMKLKEKVSIMKSLLFRCQHYLLYLPNDKLRKSLCLKS